MPLFISRRRLEKLNRLPRARGPIAIDSGGFSELSLHGEWSITVDHYIEEIRRYVACIGNVVFAAQMDHMCEPFILQKTGKTVEKHQRLTLENYLELMEKAPELPWAPVLQGWTVGSYWEHAEAFQKAGVDLSKVPVVGVGSICRRQATTRACALLATLKADGLNTHAFGYKSRGLPFAQEFIRSADSLAWSFNARRNPPLPECVGVHQHCNTCLKWALRWRAKVMKLLNVVEPPREEPPVQGMLF